MTSKLITTPEAAEILGVQPNTMERWRLIGEGPTYRKIGRLVKYYESDITAYIEAQSRRSTSEKVAA